MKTQEVVQEAPKSVIDGVFQALLDVISQIPKTEEEQVTDPVARSRTIVIKAASKAAAVSGTLALPPGPLGLLTILPDLLAIWKIQAQMVADITGVFGKTAFLSKEQMVYCLFKHGAAQAVRDIVVRIGERTLIRRTSLRVIQKTLRRISVNITQKLAGRAISRWIPIVGAVAVGWYAFYDTRKVGKTAIDLFQKNLEIQNEDLDKLSLSTSHFSYRSKVESCFM
jgi:hypothetical protein